MKSRLHRGLLSSSSRFAVVLSPVDLTVAVTVVLVVDFDLVDSDLAYLKTVTDGYGDCLFRGDALGWWGHSTTHACEGYQAP